MESKSEIIEKIRKLLALSQSKNQFEAELAAQRASEMMKKYQIDSAVVEASSIKSGKERVADVHFQVPDLRMKYQWVETLGLAAAKLFDGTVLINRSLHGTGFTFVGFQSEIPAMKEMFLHFYNSWKSFVEVDLAEHKEKSKTYFSTWEPRDTMKFKHGHGQGYAAALVVRCQKLAEDRMRKVAAQSNDCQALVLVRGGELQLWMQENNVKTVKRTSTRGDDVGYNAGRRAGLNVAIGGALHD